MVNVILECKVDVRILFDWSAKLLVFHTPSSCVLLGFEVMCTAQWWSSSISYPYWRISGKDSQWYVQSINTETLGRVGFGLQEALALRWRIILRSDPVISGRHLSVSRRISICSSVIRNQSMKMAKLTSRVSMRTWINYVRRSAMKSSPRISSKCVERTSLSVMRMTHCSRNGIDNKRSSFSCGWAKERRSVFIPIKWPVWC